MEYKRYTAFVSSNFESLKKERGEVITCLLDAQLIPICMEHFTAATNEKFKYIQSLIDQSDIFVMILGDVYGSCDVDGVSWTQKEYEYAEETNKVRFVLLTPAYVDLKKRFINGEDISEDQKKLILFEMKIGFGQMITEDRPISRIIQQAISGDVLNRCAGWIRCTDQNNTKWQNNNRIFDLGGKWYHVHLKKKDNNYIRFGEVTIKQKFDPENFALLHFKASNYEVVELNPENGTIKLDKLKKTSWSGDYLIDKEEKQVKGVYTARRFFREQYGDWIIEEGIYQGVHILDIVDEDTDEDSTDKTMQLAGTFNDVTPSPKNGLLYLFRNKEERNRFVTDHFAEIK